MNNITTTFIDQDGSIVRISALYESDNIITVSGEIVGKTTGEFDFNPSNESQMAIYQVMEKYNSKRASHKEWQEVVRVIENAKESKKPYLAKTDVKFIALSIYLGIPSSVNIKAKRVGDNIYQIGTGTLMICTELEALNESRKKIELMISNKKSHEILSSVSIGDFIYNLDHDCLEQMKGEMSQMDLIRELINRDQLRMVEFIDAIIEKNGFGEILDIYDGTGGQVKYEDNNYFIFVQK